jgi:hypothetical protein
MNLAVDTFADDGETIATLTPLISVSFVRNKETGYGDLGLTQAKRIAGAPSLARLRALTIELTGGHVKAIQTLVDSPHARGLESVRFGSAIGVQGARAIMRLPSLRSIHLHAAHIGDAGIAAILTPTLAHVTHLELGENELTPAGLDKLVSSPYASALRSLGLANNPLGPRGVKILAASPLAAHLQSLAMSGIRDEGARLLADRKAFPKLSSLDVWGSRLSPAAQAALRKRFGGYGMTE